MEETALQSLELYLSGDMDFDTFESSIVLMLPSIEARDDSPVFELLAEIIYVWDGLSDEAAFRERTSKLLSDSRAAVTVTPA